MSEKQIIVLGGGCFWCTEAVYKQLKGVESVAPGYAGGKTEHPTYEQVSTGETGHAEVIKIEYNPEELVTKDLLTVFFAVHDPTTLNRQGNDVGTQYRSIILYTNDEQRKIAEDLIYALNQEGPKVATELKSFDKFFPAEDYHKDYYQNNQEAPYCQIVINPKLEKLKHKFHQLIKI